MTTPTGTRLGRYEVRSPLGAGGMGEVYLALDLSLGRKVALKILPTHFPVDQETVRRFRQEAQAASALSHPNIAHIYEIGEVDGVHFIAMEYIEGQSLDRRIGGHPLDARDIAQIGMQVADALDEAHAQGIIHRDIKSSNIIITPRGQVKVLDFGLAKVTGPAEQTSDSAVATRVKTSPGVVMGTANYMSPEQALGREVDHRTDLFSLGVVLYEMSTGRLPFAGASVTETIDRIAHAQPDAIARFNYNAPPALDLIIRKALRKNRDERFQSAHDLFCDLKELKQDLDSGTQIAHSIPLPEKTSASIVPSGEVPLTEPARKTEEVAAAHTTSSAEYIVSEIKRHKVGALLTLGGVVLLVLAAAGGLYEFTVRRAQKQDTTKPLAMKLSRLTTSGSASEASISPDGKYVAFSAGEEDGRRSLWIKQLAAGGSLQIVPPARAYFIGTTFSLDSNFVYYVMGDEQSDVNSLYQVPVIGGNPKKLLANVDSPVALAPDGKQIAFVYHELKSGLDNLMVANLDGTGVRTLATRSGTGWFVDGGPSWSPDGKTIAVGGGDSGGEWYNALFEVRVDSGAVRQLTPKKWKVLHRVCWMPDGGGLVALGVDGDDANTQVWRITYPGGEVSQITNDLHDHGESSLGLTSDSSMLVTLDSDDPSDIWMAPANQGGGQAEQITSTPGGHLGRQGLASTPDGRFVYASIVSGNLDIWLMDADGRNQKQLTSDVEADSRPTVSHDGRYVAFESKRGNGVSHIWRMDMDGGNLKQLTESEDYEPSFSPDGKWIVYHSYRTGKSTIWRVPVEGGAPVQLTDYTTQVPVVSPDGKLIVCTYFDEQVSPKRWRFALIPFDGGQPIKLFDRTQVQAQRARWSPDGHSLFYLGGPIYPANLWSVSIDGTNAPKPVTSFKTGLIYSFDVSHDGKRLAISRGNPSSDLVLIKDFK
jgi:serine/threonine protein kinase/dipeptidyl aminopeptidase/acylaminoacyl peptidase